MKKKIRFGVLGCSKIAEKSMIPAIKKFIKFPITYDRKQIREKKLKIFSKKIFQCKLHGDYDEILENNEIDAVYISLPPNLHEK